MQLSKKILGALNKDDLSVPDEKIFQLPEKILQFGSGVLLRGLIDYFIDKANKNAVFNGRVVVVHSIEKERPVAHENQDYLYTHCLRGIQNGTIHEEYVINAAISRVLLAFSEWEKVLACAEDPDIEIIISNTTEVGIVLHPEDNINGTPPASFPGKLLALLYHRYKRFNGDVNKGWTIVPAELIADNGTKLQSILIELAHLNKLEYEFINWIENANRFCNTLVDRIVPGKLAPAEQQSVEQMLGYTDAMTIMSEPYSLWAIETTDPSVKEILSFAKVNPSVIITDNIKKYRELKLRLLNSTHTFICGLAYLAGYSTVKDAMQDEVFSQFVYTLMISEISPCIIGDEITESDALAFSKTVIERFKNPFIEHFWLSITLNYSYKMQSRNVPLLLAHYKKSTAVPRHMALSFAAYLLFMRCKETTKGYEGNNVDITYPIQDDQASFYAELWKSNDLSDLVTKALGNVQLWDTDLNLLPGFANTVFGYLTEMVHEGMNKTLSNFQNNQNHAINETQRIKST
jgi:tagaturonate reductase